MIEVKNLTKVFDGVVTAVDNISFSVKKGDVLGFLGPNGAGKSTTMKMISSFVTPTTGEITVDGHSVLTDPIVVKRKIGYMPENSPLYEDMRVRSFLEFAAELREIETSKVSGEVDRVIEQCFLRDVCCQQIGTLSKGFKKRVSLAQVFLHDPDILILDEPTDGLDPNQKYEVRNLIRRLGEEKCIILSTHILEEMDMVCNRAIIIAKGKLLFDGTPSELKGKSKSANYDDVFRAITLDENVAGVSL